MQKYYSDHNHFCFYRNVQQFELVKVQYGKNGQVSDHREFLTLDNIGLRGKKTSLLANPIGQ